MPSPPLYVVYTGSMRVACPLLHYTPLTSIMHCFVFYPPAGIPWEGYYFPGLILEFEVIKQALISAQMVTYSLGSKATVAIGLDLRSQAAIELYIDCRVLTNMDNNYYDC